MTQVTIGGGRVICEMDEAAQDEYKQVVGWLQTALTERDVARAEYRLLAERVRRVAQYYAHNTADWVALMAMVGTEPPFEFPNSNRPTRAVLAALGAKDTLR